MHILIAPCVGLHMNTYCYTRNHYVQPAAAAYSAMEDDSFTEEEREAIAYTPNGEYDGAQLIYQYEQKQKQEAADQAKQVLCHTVILYMYNN
jgi:hypothetical protein